MIRPWAAVLLLALLAPAMVLAAQVGARIDDADPVHVKAATTTTTTATTTTAPPTTTTTTVVRKMRGEWPWDALAECEADGDWTTDAYHDGGLQFHPGTWLRYGGGNFATYAWQATREQQIIIAKRVLAAEGWDAWPTCSRELGLR